jgi:hypothetical protein
MKKPWFGRYGENASAVKVPRYWDLKDRWAVVLEKSAILMRLNYEPTS